MNPFISVVLPCFNRALYLDKAIVSVLNQSYQDFELIIVNDGSTDNTEEVVKKYSDERIRYFYKENEERNFARNFGIDRALGKYITFLDSDDYILPSHFKEGHDLITENSFPEIAHLGFEVRNEMGEIIKVFNDFKKRQDYILSNNYLHCNAIFILNEVAQKLKFLNSKNAILGEDHYLWLRLLARYELVSKDVVTCVIVDHKNRSLKNIDVKKLTIGTHEIINSLKGDSVFMVKHKQKAFLLFALKLCFLALVLTENKRKNEAYTILGQALKTYPKILFYKRFIAPLKNTLLLELNSNKITKLLMVCF